MTGKLQGEIRQKKAFATLEEEAYLNLARTTDSFARDIEVLLQPYGITSTQYNVLRILRGAGAEGATCTEISERLLTMDPDVTRLLDRLEKSGLAERARSTTDRRVVLTKITDEGQKLLQQLDEPVRSLHKRQFRKLPREELSRLVTDLEKLRSKD
jgi:DNA-binding MarR family transcriptional regulator